MLTPRDKYLIAQLVDNLSVNLPDSELAGLLRRKFKNTPEPQVSQAVRFAIRHHHANNNIAIAVAKGDL